MHRSKDLEKIDSSVLYNCLFIKTSFGDLLISFSIETTMYSFKLNRAYCIILKLVIEDQHVFLPIANIQNKNKNMNLRVKKFLFCFRFFLPSLKFIQFRHLREFEIVL